MAENIQDDGGVQFPRVAGERSTQRTGKAVFAAAVRYVDAGVADRIESTSNWRKRYLGPVRELTELGTRSAKDALRMAADGLDAVQREFVFERGGATRSLEGAFGPTDAAFTIATIEGRGERWTEVVIPYRGRELRGDELRLQLERWVRAGTIEPSAAHAVTSVMEHPEWLDLADVTIAVLGAASEMGPLQWLSRWGAHVIAVDLPGKRIWQRVELLVHDGSGQASVPVRAGLNTDDITESAGLDLVRQTPELCAWLRPFGPLTLGNYTYADGATFVRVAVAADAVASQLAAEGRLNAYAYLASPTEVYAVPRQVVERARARHGTISRVPRALTGNRVFVPNYSNLMGDGESGIYDCLVPQQGANYALAKALQRWRAIAFKNEGVRVSATVAPATRTRSVTKNKILAAAYAGAGPFGVEVFEPETSRALTSALLVRDLRDAASAADPSAHLDHPYDLFVEGAAHGGLWSLPYEPRTVLPLAVLLGLPRRRTWV
jgi:hypothetical protein